LHFPSICYLILSRRYIHLAHAKPVGSHGGQVKAGPRKRRNRAERIAALQAEADQRGITVGELQGEKGLQYSALIADLARQRQVAEVVQKAKATRWGYY
jgi:hypothetical protein